MKWTQLKDFKIDNFSLGKRFTTKASMDMNSTPVPGFNSYTFLLWCFLPIRDSSVWAYRVHVWKIE